MLVLIINEKYNNLLLRQANDTNELKQQIKLLMEQMEKERKKYNENMILIEAKHKIEKEQQNINNQINQNVNISKDDNIDLQKGGSPSLDGNLAMQGENVKMFDIRDKKAREFFNKDIQLFNEKKQTIKQNEEKNKYKNISYSTDYMVDYLKMSPKMKEPSDKIISNETKTHPNTKYLNELKSIKEQSEEEEHDDNLQYKNIFIKHESSESTDNYIDVGKVKILKSDSDDNDKKKILQNELEDFITNNKNIQQDNNIENNQNNQNNVVFVGGGKKNSFEIRKIDSKYKMKFDNVFSTLTEQNIDFKDDAKIKKIRHKKYMRRSREKNKLADLQDELNK